MHPPFLSLTQLLWVMWPGVLNLVHVSRASPNICSFQWCLRPLQPPPVAPPVVPLRPWPQRLAPTSPVTTARSEGRPRRAARPARPGGWGESGPRSGRRSRTPPERRRWETYKHRTPTRDQNGGLKEIRLHTIINHFVSFCELIILVLRDVESGKDWGWPKAMNSPKSTNSVMIMWWQCDDK